MDYLLNTAYPSHPFRKVIIFKNLNFHVFVLKIHGPPLLSLPYIDSIRRFKNEFKFIRTQRKRMNISNTRDSSKWWNVRLAFIPSYGGALVSFYIPLFCISLRHISCRFRNDHLPRDERNRDVFRIIFYSVFQFREPRPAFSLRSFRTTNPVMETRMYPILNIRWIIAY